MGKRGLWLLVTGLWAFGICYLFQRLPELASSGMEINMQQASVWLFWIANGGFCLIQAVILGDNWRSWWLTIITNPALILIVMTWQLASTKLEIFGCEYNYANVGILYGVTTLIGLVIGARRSGGGGRSYARPSTKREKPNTPAEKRVMGKAEFNLYKLCVNTKEKQEKAIESLLRSVEYGNEDAIRELAKVNLNELDLTQTTKDKVTELRKQRGIKEPRQTSITAEDISQYTQQVASMTPEELERNKNKLDQMSEERKQLGAKAIIQDVEKQIADGTANADSYILLCNFYREGMGVPKDKRKALECLYQAIKLDPDKGVDIYGKLSTMDAEVIAQDGVHPSEDQIRKMIVLILYTQGQLEKANEHPEDYADPDSQEDLKNIRENLSLMKQRLKDI